MESTNELEFCTSCHGMKFVYQEYQHSSHYSNASGVQAVCADCHVPKDWTAKLIRKIRASKEVFYWLTGSINTAEKFNKKRYELAQSVWHSMEESDSRECRSCHNLKQMNLNEQSLFAQSYHAQAELQQQTCINCHKGITHELAKPEPVVFDLDVEYAEDINQTCIGCHGEFGQGDLDGEYPRLAGLSVAYITKQIEAFKHRKRINIPMIPYATDRELPADDIKTIAHYLSNIELPTRQEAIDEDNFNALSRLVESKKVVNISYSKGNADAGQKLYQQECDTCHGRKAQGNYIFTAPPLAGQRSKYVKRQMKQFKNAKRVHYYASDADIFKQFTEAQIDDLLSYLASLDDL